MHICHASEWVFFYCSRIGDKSLVLKKVQVPLTLMGTLKSGLDTFLGLKKKCNLWLNHLLFPSWGELRLMYVSFLGLSWQSTTVWVADTTEIYFLMVLEARFLRPSVGRVSFFWGFCPWLVDDCLLPEYSHYFSSLPVSTFPRLRRTQILLD